MSISIKIDGIYDEQTLLSCVEEGVSHFGFDFRPKSFNFLQQHVFMEMLKKFDRPDFYFHLHFDSESDFVVKKFCDDILKIKNFSDKYILNFEELNSVDFFSQFSFPFIVKYRPGLDYSDFFENKYFKGFTFDYFELEENYLQNLNSQYANKLLTNIFQKISDRNLLSILKVDWDTHFHTGLFEFLSFSHISLSINQKMEISYRNPNVAEISRNIHNFKQIDL